MSETPLFEYTFATAPAPLQVGASGRLNIGVTAPAGSGGAPVAYCNQIVVAVPVEGGDTPLFADDLGGSLSTNRWSVSSRVVPAAETGLPAVVGDEVYVVFYFECGDATDYGIDYPLVLAVAGTVAAVAGTGTVYLQEQSGTTADPSTFTKKQTTCTLATTWPQFYLENLSAADPASPTIPCTAFPANAPVRLSWESNGSYFQLFATGSAIVPAWQGTTTWCELDPGFPVVTTCTLVASLTGPPGQDTPTGGYEPVYRYSALSVTITDPALSAASIAVASGVSAATVEVSGQLSAGSVAVATGVSAATVEVSGQLSAGSATVSGALSADTGAFADGLTAGGVTSLAGLNLAGPLTSGSAFVATGAVSALAAPRSIAGGAEPAQSSVASVTTDGLAMLQLLPPAGASGVECSGYGWITVAGNAFGVSGGTRTNGAGELVADVHCVTVPIPANSEWSFGLNPGNPCPFWQLFWFPLGTGPTPVVPADQGGVG